MLEFNGADFDSADALERVFTAAVASASLPVVFSPTHVPGLGDCVDGGAVNNNPIGYAFDVALGQQIGTVILVAPTVALKGVSARHLRGWRLIGHLIEMLINERLYPDLRDTEQIRESMARLAALSPDILDPTWLAAVKAALGWARANFDQVALSGSSFGVGVATPGAHDTTLGGFSDAFIMLFTMFAV